ncbi:hypothetical protein BX616_007244 [Lobosporangium transversale]|nr:hypothetical protein BX616_007244 [Lobosporangium transversale]
MSLPIPQHSHYRSTASLDKNSFLIPQKFSRRPTSFTSPIISTLVVLAFVGWPSFFVQLTMAVAPRPVGGFAICQTTSSLHIQGGVTYSDDGTYLTTTNQHFRLDLSKGFSLSGASNPPVWVNMTTHYSPFQRFHAGACTPDSATFLTVGNADSVNTGASGGGFMMAYSVTKGTWIAVTQAVSEATGSNNNGSGRRYDQTGAGAGIVGAGRTMPGFALATTTNNKAITGQGVVIGGGWISQKGSTHSALATELTNLVTEADLVTIGSDGSVESLTWSVVPKAGNGGYNVNRNLGSLAGAKVVILPSSGKAVVLGGVTGGRSNGLSFSTIPIIDMATGVVILQV